MGALPVLRSRETALPQCPPATVLAAAERAPADGARLPGHLECVRLCTCWLTNKARAMHFLHIIDTAQQSFCMSLTLHSNRLNPGRTQGELLAGAFAFCATPGCQDAHPLRAQKLLDFTYKLDTSLHWHRRRWPVLRARHERGSGLRPEAVHRPQPFHSGCGRHWERPLRPRAAFAAGWLQAAT